jgi:hypothetical protein
MGQGKHVGRPRDAAKLTGANQPGQSKGKPGPITTSKLIPIEHSSITISDSDGRPAHGRATRSELGWQLEQVFSVPGDLQPHCSTDRC